MYTPCTERLLVVASSRDRRGRSAWLVVVLILRRNSPTHHSLLGLGSLAISDHLMPSVLVHPLTAEQRRDHESRNAWMGTPWPIYLEVLPNDGPIPLQYPELGLGWSTSPEQEISLEERRKRGAEVEAMLAHDPEAAPAPKD